MDGNFVALVFACGGFLVVAVAALLLYLRQSDELTRRGRALDGLQELLHDTERYLQHKRGSRSPRSEFGSPRADARPPPLPLPSDDSPAISAPSTPPAKAPMLGSPPKRHRREPPLLPEDAAGQRALRRRVAAAALRLALPHRPHSQLRRFFAALRRRALEARQPRQLAGAPAASPQRWRREEAAHVAAVAGGVGSYYLTAAYPPAPTTRPPALTEIRRVPSAQPTASFRLPSVESAAVPRRDEGSASGGGAWHLHGPLKTPSGGVTR
eukprot:TRINITY_DN20041_c0_g1_i2.p1 TRINITY_DN20041_c0_g1~~TRINITY_DN20041_c0_g1_i2.p1  ORF type:complete len:268 (+),score=63.08 TRINITY_DN20041_c0_g1_i2:91-894(+)